jgi:hypothetical protein
LPALRWWWLCWRGGRMCRQMRTMSPNVDLERGLAAGRSSTACCVGSASKATTECELTA